MKTTDNVYHQGTILSIDKGKAEVRIIQKSACSSCHAKSMCSMSDMKEKNVEVSLNPGSQYTIGDIVTVVLARSLGTKAVLLAYFIPFVVMISTLFLVWGLSGNEAISGLAALGILAPYYLILSLFKKKLKNQYEFRLAD